MHQHEAPREEGLIIGDDGSAADDQPDLSGLASVIYVARDDDIAAICGRIDSAPTFAVVLHAPRGNHAISRELGMRRVIRHAEDAGKTVAVATRSPSLASRARQAGLPVAWRPERIRWDAGGRVVVGLGPVSVKMPPIGRYVSGLLLLVAIAAVGAALLFAAPSATVTVVPPTEVREATVIVTASTTTQGFDPADMRVPATGVSASRQITLAVPTTGSIQVPVAAATVTLTVSNGGDAPVTVPAGAIATTEDGVAFATDDAVEVPPDGEAVITATAVAAGPGGNVPAGAVTRWEDGALAGLAVTNPEDAAGGASEPRRAVDAADIVAIRQLVEELAVSDALRQSLVEQRPNDAVFLRTAEVRVIEGKPSANAGDVANVVFMDVTVRVSALAILSETLDEVARVVLGDGPGDLVPGTVRAVETGARQVNLDEGAIRTELLVSAAFARGITAGSIRSAVKGKSADKAKSTLAERYGIQEADVDLTPGWAPWLPRFDFRIDVRLQSRLAAGAGPGGIESNGDATDASSQPATSTARP
ncbi:MAG: hypothetical protein Kow0010_22190 [Dehalococcoidia bacterium]